MDKDDYDDERMQEWEILLCCESFIIIRQLYTTNMHRLISKDENEEWKK